jgi:hypothetical protein
MLIHDFKKVGSVVSAAIDWEQGDRSERMWFDVRNSRPDSPIDVNAFLVGAFPLATVSKERRIFVDGAMSPVLAEGLRLVRETWKFWGFDAAPAVEAALMSEPSTSGENAAYGFLSGGVDSVHMLYQNHQFYPQGHPRRISVGLVADFGLGSGDDAPGVLERRLKSLGAMAAETGVELRAVRTNLRAIYPDIWWGRFFHGPALAAVAHAATAGSSYVTIASSYDLAGMHPWGSHPALDPAFSTERVTILHRGEYHSRLEKVGVLAEHRVALDNIEVCANGPNGTNCRICEKCVRTMLELKAVGAWSKTFAGSDVTPDDIRKVSSAIYKNAGQFYVGLAPALRDQGCDELADALENVLRRQLRLESITRFKHLRRVLKERIRSALQARR